MKSLVEAAFVIGRRDFVATVYSKTFLFFLLGPLLIIGLSIVMGNSSERLARQDFKTNVAVIAGAAEFRALKSARARLAPAFGGSELPTLVHAEPDYVQDAQVRDLLASRDKRIRAVLTGGITRPTLVGDLSEDGSIRKEMQLILDEARQQRALDAAGLRTPAIAIRLVKVEESAGSLAAMRTLTARTGQLLLFMLTVFLAGMLLSNLVEEKSNKIIEVLTAAVPVNAIFLGKLFAMLAVSMVGIAVWAGGALLALNLWGSAGGLPEPAVGWTIFVLLVLLYFTANYLLLGGLFLGIGSQASSVREVQTLSMPVMIGQALLFLFASFAVGPFNGIIGIAAAAFPFSSPLAMIARAAQTPELWPHLAALGWQALWVWLTVSLAAGLFRRNVMKSGSAPAFPSFSRRGESRPPV